MDRTGRNSDHDRRNTLSMKVSGRSIGPTTSSHGDLQRYSLGSGDFLTESNQSSIRDRGRIEEPKLWSSPQNCLSRGHTRQIIGGSSFEHDPDIGTADGTGGSCATTTHLLLDRSHRHRLAGQRGDLCQSLKRFDQDSDPNTIVKRLATVASGRGQLIELTPRTDGISHHHTPLLHFSTIPSAHIDVHALELENLLPFCWLEKMGRLAADRTGNLAPTGGQQIHSLCQQHVAPPAAEGNEVNSSLVVDRLDGKSHLVHVSIENHSRTGSISLDDDAAVCVML